MIRSVSMETELTLNEHELESYSIPIQPFIKLNHNLLLIIIKNSIEIEQELET